MPEGETLDVTAIVIAYKTGDAIGDVIAAHEAALAHLDAEVIIVDNASGDGTVAAARAAINRGHVIANEENLGYGHAANMGIEIARGRACLILNDDARLSSTAVDRLLDVLDSDPRIALVGPRIIDEKGDPMPSARLEFPGLAEEFRLAGDALARINRNNIYPEISEPTDVAWLVGACILGQTDVLRIAGGFNPVFFLYVEDIDLCKRVTVLGHRVVSVPDAECVHVGSVSTSAAFSDQARIRRRADARNLFYRLWYRKPTRMLINARRAIGKTNQPMRLRYHLPKVFADGGSLRSRRFPPGIGSD